MEGHKERIEPRRQTEVKQKGRKSKNEEQYFNNSIYEWKRLIGKGKREPFTLSAQKSHALVFLGEPQ